MAGSDGTVEKEAAVISRRDAIIGALALAAGSLIAQKPDTARATNGQYVLVGGAYTSSESTLIMRTFDGSLSAAYSSGGLTTNVGWVHYGIDGQTFGGDPGGAGAYGHTAVASHYGVLAQHTGGGTALRVEGKASFSRSGKATITKGHAGCTVTVPSGVDADTLVLATLRGSAGTGVHLLYAKYATATTFTVKLNKAATSTVSIAWLIIG
jgi:hypothetical protein